MNFANVIGEVGGGKAQTRVEGSLNLEDRQKHILKIQHIPTGYTVTMPAFLDSFSDAYTSEWSEQPAYGRMDSAATFAGTKRNISIAWNLPAESFEHAQQNLTKINALINFLYPLYDVQKRGQDPVLNMDPILRLSFGNLVRDVKTGRGLLGYVNGITFDPVVEEGMFHSKPTAKGASLGNSRNSTRAGQTAARRLQIAAAGGNPQNNQYYPKTVRLNLEFKVLHEHSLGFSVSAEEPATGGRTRASYTFNDPALNFSNYPIMTNASGEGINRQANSLGGALRRQPTTPGSSKDPGVPAVVLVNSAVNPADVRVASPPIDHGGRPSHQAPITTGGRIPMD
tara:strand:- start:1181 stop:2200 length:1020 start_codon:yes stop_codon:yes gene_type:complete